MLTEAQEDVERTRESLRRVLTVIHYPVFGGPHNNAVRLHKPLEERGWRTVVLLPDEPGSGVDRLREACVPVVQLPLHRLRGKPDPVLQARYLLNLAGDIRRIRRTIRQERIDLVRITGLLNPQAGIAARLEGVPVVWQIEDSRPPRFVRLAYMRVVKLLADAVLFDGKRLVDLHGGEASVRVPWFIFYPPVDTGRFKPDPDRRLETRRRFGIPPEAPVVGMVANLNPQKGIEHFIRAAARVHRRCPEAWYLIVGERYETHRGYWEQLQAEVVTSGIPNKRVLFAGGTNRPEDYYPAMDVKVITSVPRSEGTTTTAMEAMACGVPVIASDVGAVGEVVDHDVTGFLVPPMDAGACADAVLRLIRDPALRCRLGGVARRTAVEKFDTSVGVEAIDMGLASAMLAHNAKGTAT